MVKMYFSDNNSAMTLDVTVRSIGINRDEEYLIFPESGLHPNQQAEITENLVKKEGVINVATHSEIVILRAMRMIREGRLSNDDFKLIQVCRNDDSMEYMVEIELTDEGEFLDHIKDGFFENSYNERFGI